MGSGARLLTAAALLGVAHGGVLVLQRGYVPARVEIPERELAALPRQFGVWRGQDVPLDPHVYRAIGAHSVVNRQYTDLAGNHVTLHSAILADATSGVPHLPEVCFQGSGWTIEQSKDVRLTAVAGQPSLARVLVVRREGEQAVALFWFQMGDQSFVDRDSYRHARRTFFGLEAWPAVVKVLLQTSAGSPAEAQTRLMEFGKLVLAETSQLR